jgi:hypothetical protein
VRDVTLPSAPPADPSAPLSATAVDEVTGVLDLTRYAHRTHFSLLRNLSSSAGVSAVPRANETFYLTLLCVLLSLFSDR